MKTVSFPITLLLAVLAIYGLGRAQDADDNSTVIKDSLSSDDKASIGAKLQNASVQVGGQIWSTLGDLGFEKGGGVSPESHGELMGIIRVPVHDTSKSIEIEADIKPINVKFIGLAFLSSLNPGDFWVKPNLMGYIDPNGTVGILNIGAKDVPAGPLAFAGSGSYAFNEADYNHLKLIYNPNTKMVSFKVNGKEVIPDTRVKAPLDSVDFAGIRIEASTSNLSSVKNFSISVQ
jgi:hypothetical protein